MRDLRIGMIGLDTSHAVAFTKLLNDENEKDHIKGGKVVTAFPGGSPDFDLSISRVEGFTKQIKDYDVEITDTIEETAENSAAILLESVDGAQHLEQLRKIIPYRKPVFIDKPFALNSADADEMIKLSREYGTPIMSTSALRFAEGLTSVLDQYEKGKIIGADCFGPMEIQEKQPGFFWYGIHAVEMLLAILGEGAEKVISAANEDHDVLTGYWKDGRIGTIRGNRKGNSQFGAMIHFEEASEFVSINKNQKPFYVSLLEQIMGFFHSGESPVALSETRELIRFIEAANESRISGKSVFI
ncbi:oxidoreductase [Virgibacillus indicus]|uniref:Oxidoreductase n=1 Tax=Virgibacillus indicus TaxID=2024554 RepID=A0A265N8M1_9BACI|nr:Gfo/Idh/MocA family oxidoreductase [Virgibacillus indicus]OZU88343.1 oxidoreductase [Virgibacillus indicus]